jgi:peptide/nickel transport system substrate-binding protein
VVLTRASTLLLFLSLLAFLPTAQAQDTTETLKMGWLYEDIANWDPHQRVNTSSTMYYDFVYDTLIWLSPAGELQPRLATRWELTDTALNLTLREGVTFHDGTAFNAEAAKANLDRARLEGSGLVRTAFDAVESVDVLGEFTVQINLSRRDDLLLENLTRYAGMMASPAAFDTLDAAPVGAGAWTLNTEDTIPSSVFVYDKFPDHWRADSIDIERAEIRVTRGPTGPDAMMAGDIDLLVTSAGLTRLISGDEFSFDVQGATWYLVVLWDRNGELLPELADERVRCALNHAINRDTYNQAIEAGLMAVMETIPPRGWYGYTAQAPTYDYDPQRAQALLAAAGAEGFTLPLPTASGFTQRNQALAGFLSQVGINAAVEAIPDGTMFSVAYSGEVPAMMINLNPTHFTEFVADFFAEDGTGNTFSVVDEDIAALVAQADGLPLDEAEPIWQEISVLISERCYFVPVTAGSLALVTNENVQNVQPVLNQAARPDLHALTLADE